VAQGVPAQNCFAYFSLRQGRHTRNFQIDISQKIGEKFPPQGSDHKIFLTDLSSHLDNGLQISSSYLKTVAVDDGNCRGI